MAANIWKITYAKAKSDLSGNYARAIILCDTAADLPAVNAFTNYELIQGSEAVVINENTKYMMDSGGNWFISGETFTDVYTKQQIDTLLQGKQDGLTAVQMDAVNSGITAAKLTADEAALAELYERNNIIDISSAVTAETGYTVESTTHLYYQNKKVFGTIAIAINSGSYSSTLTAIAKLPVEYAPARQYLDSCKFSTNQWAITNIGYAFIQAANASFEAQRGQISVKSPTANLTHMILNVCYPVQIDVTL